MIYELKDVKRCIVFLIYSISMIAPFDDYNKSYIYIYTPIIYFIDYSNLIRIHQE